MEAPLAKIFGTSRVPVRQALTLLHQNGAIQRFEGRGYVVARPGESTEPLRQAVERAMFELDVAAEVKGIRPLGERIYSELFAQISLFMVFGRFRIDERAVTEELQAGRNLVRETLTRLADNQLIGKEPYGQWETKPLTAKALSDEFELRLALQPHILQSCGHVYARPDLLKLISRCQVARENGKRVEVEALTSDANQLLFGAMDNVKIKWALSQCQSSALLDSVLRRTVPGRLDDAMLTELESVLEALSNGAVPDAALAYSSHLVAGRRRAMDRLKVLSILPLPVAPSYLIKL